MISTAGSLQSLSRSKSCGVVWPTAHQLHFNVDRRSVRPSASGAHAAFLTRASPLSSSRLYQQHHSSSFRSRKQVVVQANWGAPVDFVAAKISSKKTVAPDMRIVHLDVGASIAAGYTKPGQYIQVKVNDADKAGFFAIASAPSASKAGVLELLIKVQPGSTAESVCALAEGTQVLVSPVQGKGFPIDKIPHASTVLLIATGSGISPMKAVIESGVLNSGKEVRLYYGTKDKAVTAFQELIPKWEAAGIKVHQVFSGSNKRYVQTVLKEEADAGRLVSGGSASSVGVLLCGHKDMCTSATAILTEAGVEASSILMNF